MTSAACWIRSRPTPAALEAVVMTAVVTRLATDDAAPADGGDVESRQLRCRLDRAGPARAGSDQRHSGCGQHRGMYAPGRHWPLLPAEARRTALLALFRLRISLGATGSGTYSQHVLIRRVVSKDQAVTRSAGQWSRWARQ
jgi:hypothetical protein